MTAGIIYSAVIFKKIGILWFLFLPIANSITIQFGKNSNETNDKEGEGEWYFYTKTWSTYEAAWR